ncbi:glycosyltransferase [Oceanobacillus sp. Castelsardo]|uniref:glycosyltransferase family protein n=1 Tax=Oceanobacillus sp. Castelsardo TaxID=1851204 RepID=UPI000838C972|nr:glycosyltransferase [Oceanobacillus sp. Castelsardo]
MIHILFITEDTSQLLNKNFYYLEQELAKLAHVTFWRENGHISSILKKLSIRPDFILLLNDIGKKISPMIKGLANIDIPVGLFINDAHRFTSYRRNFISKNKISHLFTVARDKCIEIYPEFQHKMEWFPHFVNSEIYKDYHEQKDIHLLMMGAVNDIYPLRQKIFNTYKLDSRFVYHKHPGYKSFNEQEENQLFIGPRYAKEINRAKIFFTCPSIHYYPIRKYFEALACNSLLLAPTFKELEDLGFVPGFHFVSIDENNFKEKAAYYLENETKREQIAEQGYLFIHENHSAKIRACELIKKMESIVHK